ncbi:MAG: SUMF1/EgtB/PvdO family nonheme iron enzyme [Anaerolineales bacterium]|nr:SUMF1/EgtB/PvdO family nonheme iron enzyme [Anaerolineales bacterium]
MKYIIHRFATLLLLFLFLGACSILPISSHELGDTWTRPVDNMVMVYVPAGSFTIGTSIDAAKEAVNLCKEVKAYLGIAACRFSSFVDEMPAHIVLLDGFWIDQHEVTNRQYMQCVEAAACEPPAEISSYTREAYYGDEAYDEYPVVWVTKDHAADYCAWVEARLPSEAEWEFAARGPESYRFPWGEEFDGTRLNFCDVNCELGFADTSADDGYEDTAPVGSYPSGESWCGALDMAGNVREWVADWFGYYAPEEQHNPQGPMDGTAYVPKGGSFFDPPDNIRSANRGGTTLDYVRHKVGFRCARTQ